MRRDLMLDYAVLENLRSLQKINPAILHEVIELFVKSTPEEIKNMRQALAQCDLANLKYFSHRLKSTCGNLGVLRMKELCQEIESLRDLRFVEQVEEQLRELLESYECAKKELQSYLDSTRQG